MIYNAQKEKPNSVEAELSELALVRDEITVLKEKEEKIKETILNFYKSSMEAKYKEKGEPFGAASFVEEFGKVIFTTPKNVKWDQEGLKKLYADGAPVDIEFSVSETEFKKQDDAGKAAFMKYRTIKPGKVIIEVKFND